MDMGVVGVEGAGGRDGVLEGRCCVFEGVLDLQNESWSSLSPLVIRRAATITC